jgi:hypothetical protein
MSIMRRRWVGAAGVLGAALALAAPAFAQHGGGGGGGGHGGGGGGGGHASAGHFGGGGHASAGHFGGGGVHYAAGAHYAGGAHFAAAGAAAHGYGPVGHGYAGSAYGGHAAYGYPGGGYQHGYSTGATWRGGYWHGGYWPRAYYGLGFAWFLPVLPLAYATYWYDGLPYYYANDVYYTWNPDYSGYTATDPPPVTDSSAGADGAAAPPEGLSGAGQGAPDPSVGAQIFMYPKNGQSEQQQSDDKRECQQWAASQAGQGAANSSDYRRAMLACIEGRGYSAN